MTAAATIRPCPECGTQTATRRTLTDAMKAAGIRERAGGGKCPACYIRPRRKPRPSRAGIALAPKPLPPIRNEIATNARPDGWERDRNGVMRYVGIEGGSGNLDDDYAEELIASGIRVDHEGIDTNELVRLYVDDEMSLLEIGKLVGRDKKTVGRALRAAGVTIRPSGIRIAEEEQPCGTASAARRHLRRGEPSCEACLRADARRVAERRAA